MPTRFAVAKGPVKLNSIIVDIDEDTGKSCIYIKTQHYRRIIKKDYFKIFLKTRTF